MQVGGKGGVVGWGVRAHEKLKNVKGKRFTVRTSISNIILLQNIISIKCICFYRYILARKEQEKARLLFWR